MMKKYTLFAVTISREILPQFLALPGRIWFSATLVFAYCERSSKDFDLRSFCKWSSHYWRSFLLDNLLQVVKMSQNRGKIAKMSWNWKKTTEFWRFQSEIFYKTISNVLEISNKDMVSAREKSFKFWSYRVQKVWKYPKID